MRKQLELKLVEKYPEIFRDYNGNIQETCMAWGMECGDGWYHIINDLCATITAQLRYAKYRKQQIENDLAVEDKSNWPEWLKNSITPEKLDEINKEIEEEIQKVPVAVQVKEKYGTLRFYINGGTDAQHALISMAERMSEHTCEVCGDTNARTWHEGWHKTLCMEHAIENYGDVVVEEYLKSESEDVQS